MEWLAKLFTKYPEMAVYLAVGIGYLIGRLKFREVGLGVVTGSLLGGILIGNFFHVPVSDQAKSLVFLLFLFGIGYSVGPSFFQNLKGDGWRWAVLGTFVPIIGLITAYTVAQFLKTGSSLVKQSWRPKSLYRVSASLWRGFGAKGTSSHPSPAPSSRRMTRSPCLAVPNS